MIEANKQLGMQIARVALDVPLHRFLYFAGARHQVRSPLIKHFDGCYIICGTVLAERMAKQALVAS